MKKVEQVARAICRANNLNPDEIDISNGDRPIPMWMNWEGDALAALRAMREPDIGMVSAGWQQLKRAHLPHLGPGPGFSEAFMAAMDVAIREAETPTIIVAKKE